MDKTIDNLTRSMQTKQVKRALIQADLFNSDLSMKQIAIKHKVSTCTVHRWKHRSNIMNKKKTRQTKYKQEHIDYIVNRAEGKYTGIDKASSRVIASELAVKYGNQKTKKGKKFSLSYETVNNILNKFISKPRRARKTFKLTADNMGQRRSFYDYIMDRDDSGTYPILKGREIFFTDESRFLLDCPLNPQTNRIRFSKENLEKLKKGDPTITEKLHKPIPKYTTGFMVAGGLSYYGPGELIFCVGTMDTNCYLRTLEHYKNDVLRLNPDLYFQQDNATCHTSKLSTDYIKNNFKNHLKLWPANSPDLSPIEDLWAILKEKLYEKPHKDLKELQTHLLNLWNKIPISLCRKLIDSFDKKISQVGEGERFNRLAFKQKKKKLTRMVWKRRWIPNSIDEPTRIVLSNKTLLKTKEKATKLLEAQLSRQSKIWKERIKNNYSTTILNRLRTSSAKRYRVTLKKYQEEEEAFVLKKNQIAQKIVELKALTCNEWYESQKDDLKRKMIKFSSLSTKALNDESTLAATELSVADLDDITINESEEED